MADAKVRIEVESQPVGFDGSKQALKDLERDVKATEKAAVAAQKKLGSGNDELKKKLDAGIASLQGEQKNLAALATKYSAAQKSLAVLGKEMDKNVGRLEKMRANGETNTEEYERLVTAQDLLNDRARKQEASLDRLNKKMVESANAARSMQDALRAQIGTANGVIKANEGMTDSMKASSAGSVALFRANMALQQLMSGNFIGAFKSASAAVKQFARAIATEPHVAAILAVVAAISAVVTGLKEAKARAEEYRAAMEKIAELDAKKYRMRRSGEDQFAEIDDATLAEMAQKLSNNVLPSAQNATEAAGGFSNEAARGVEEESIPHRLFARFQKFSKGIFGIEQKTQQDVAEEAAAAYDAAIEQEENIKARLRAVREELEKRNKAAREEAEQKKKEIADAVAAADAVMKEREGFEKAAADASYEKENGREASLTKKRDELQQEKNALEEKLAPLREVGITYTEDEKKLLDVDKELLEVNKQLDAIDKKRNETQSEWERKRKLAKATEEERLKIINDEIAALRKLPRTAENEAKMRGLIDQRDATQKEIDKKNEKAQADAQKAAEKQAEDDKKLKDKARDFLHRNGGDAQRMRDIRVQLGEAAASGDMGTMLDLMMQGESIADAHPGKQTLTQRKQAERKAKHDEKEAQKEAVKMRAEISAIERGLRKGDASAIEKVAKMNAQQAGRASYEMKGGKLVKVEGTDQTNTLLHDILEALK